MESGIGLSLSGCRCHVTGVVDNYWSDIREKYSKVFEPGREDFRRRGTNALQTSTTPKKLTSKASLKTWVSTIEATCLSILSKCPWPRWKLADVECMSYVDS